MKTPLDIYPQRHSPLSPDLWLHYSRLSASARSEDTSADVDLIASEQFASTASGSTRREPQYSTCSRRAAFASIASAQPLPRLSGRRLQLVLPKAGQPPCCAGSLPCCARGALAYTRMLSKPSPAPRRRNFEWRVFTPKKIRLSSDCSGRRRKVGLGRDRARPGQPEGRR